MTVERLKAEDVVLYSHYASICSQRVRLALMEKQIPFKSVMLHYEKGETLSPTYLGINPRGVVPTVVADAEVVFDSATIVQYLNNRYEGPELLPGDDAAKEAIRHEIREADAFPVQDHVYAGVVQRRADGSIQTDWNNAHIEKYIATMKDYKEKYPAFAENYDLKIQDHEYQLTRVLDEEQMAKTVALTNKTMDDLDVRLAKQDFIVGNTFSLADISWIPIFIRLHYVVKFRIWGDGLRSNLERYFDERIRTRPSFKPAILDHYVGNIVPDGLA